MATPENKPIISVHPAAALFPLMSDEEIAELANSIKTHGLREKIHAITSVTDEKTDWQVVDGRNRLEAIRRHLMMSDTDIIATYMVPVNLAGLHATVEEYVMMANIERRNLTQAQRRDLAGKLAIMLEEQQKDLPKAEQIDTLQVAAEKAGVSRRTAATSKAKAKAPKKLSVAQTVEKEKKYIPLRPAGVLSQLENIKTTVNHETLQTIGGVTEGRNYLNDWQLDEIRKCYETAWDISNTLSIYLKQREKSEEAELRRKLAALSGEAEPITNDGEFDPAA